MMEAPIPQAQPMWRRIAAFPLVAMLLALVAILALVFATGAGLAFAGLSLAGGPLETALGAVATTIAVVIAYKLAVSRLGEAPRDDLPFDGRAKDGVRGTLLGFTIMVAVVAVAFALGGYRVDGWGTGTSWAMLLFVAGLQAAFVEEIVIRGILFRFLEEFGGSWFALAASSLFFGFAHAANPNATLLASVAIALEAGILLGAAYMLTRNLWLAIGIHFGWNVTQGFIFDVPVSGGQVDGMLDARPAGSELISGGAFGLEASVIAMVLATATGLWLLRLAIRKGELMQPWWVRRRLAREAGVQTKL